jgi:hypothetical protein
MNAIAIVINKSDDEINDDIREHSHKFPEYC